MISNLDQTELKELINNFEQIPDEVLENWLIGPEAESHSPSHEYITFTCLTMAYDYAKVLITNKT